MKAFPNVHAHPLCWPDGWSRTPDHRRGDGYEFRLRRDYSTNPPRGGDLPSVYDAQARLMRELSRLKATNVVLSTNAQQRQNGNLIERAGRFEPGIAVYFMLKGKPLVMAQDGYTTIAANLISLALAIDAMRTLERHGGGQMMERAFSGFSALPPPADSVPRRPWWEVLRYSADPEERELISVKEVEARYQTLAKRLHPDVGGKAEDMTELNLALEDAKADLKKEDGDADA